MIEERKMRRILLLNMGDAKSREFLASLTADELTEYDQIISWYAPHDLPEVEHYLLDKHYPSPSCFPSVWVELPREYTYGPEDQVARISGFTCHKEVVDYATTAMLDAIVENVQMSENFKMNYILESIMSLEGVTTEVISRFNVCRSVHQMKLMHQKLVAEGIFIKDQSLIENIKQETGVDFGEIIKLKAIEQPAPLPANFNRNR